MSEPTANPNALPSWWEPHWPPRGSLEDIIGLIELQAPEVIGSLLIAQDEVLRHGAAVRLPKEFVEKVDGVQIAEGSGACGTAAFRREPVYAVDVASDPLCTEFRDFLLQNELRACWSTPILDLEGGLIGTFAIYHPHAGLPSEFHRQMIEIVTGLVAVNWARQREHPGSDVQHDDTFSMAANGVIIVDASQPDLPITYCNPAFEKTTGYPPEEILGRNCRFLQGTDRNQEGRHRLRAAISEGRSESVRLRNYRRDGSMFWADVAVSPVRDPDGKIRRLIGIQTDVTEQQLARLCLMDSEERFRTLCTYAPIGIFLTDVEGGLSYLNEECQRITGLDHQLAHGFAWATAVHHDDREEVIAQWQQAVCNGNDFSSEHRFVRAGRHPVWVKVRASPYRGAAGNIQGFIGTVEDRTVVRKSEEQLRLTQFAVDACSIAVFWIRPDASIFYANRAVAQFGYTPDELVSKSIYDIDPQMPKEAWPEFFEQNRQLRTMKFETLLCCADGSFRSVEVTTNLLEFAGEEFLFGFVTDISERIQARQALEEANESLEQRVRERTTALQQANADLEAYAQSVAHDLRAPLRAMRVFASALNEDYGDRLDDEGRQYCQYIESAAKQMDSLIRDLLEYSRTGHSGMGLDPQNLDEVVDRALRQLGSEIQRVSAEIIVERPLGKVVGHRSSLVQILSNLISNAVKFVAEDVQPQILIRTIESTGSLKLTVKDNGLGIAPAFHEQIFGVFERLHGIESYPGTGIGLAIVRRAAESMNAEFGVESVLGDGSTFWIEFRDAGQVN